MTLQELIDWCITNGVDFDTPIALREKDDYLLVPKNVSFESNPYFGNCNNGDAYLEKVAPQNPEDVMFLILGTGY